MGNRGGLAGAILASLLCMGGVEARDLRVHISADPKTIDPVANRELTGSDVLRNVYHGFADMGLFGQPRPALALDWSADPDGRGWQFRLRPGVFFHTGKAFTAHDVKASFEVVLRAGAKAGLQSQFLQRVEGAGPMREGRAPDHHGVTVVDDRTLHVRLTSPNVLFPFYPFMIFDASVLDASDPDWSLKRSAGTGPFRFAAWNPGRELRLEAHSGYWNGAPGVDGIHYVVNGSPERTLDLYRAGAVDVVSGLGTGTVRDVMRDPALAAEMQVNYFGMNQSLYPPFRDRRVRQAFCVAVDRDALVRELFGGLAEPLHGLVTPGVAGYDPGSGKITYDPEVARRLLAEAGFPGGHGLPPLRITKTEPWGDEVQFYAERWRESLGVPVEVELMDGTAFLDGIHRVSIPFFSWGWTASFPEALNFLQHIWLSASYFNGSRYANPAFDALVDEAQRTPAREARIRLYRRAEEALKEDWGSCGLFVRKIFALLKPNVMGIVLTPMRFLPFDRIRVY
jgi:peptide/nickel transport system substrate-binding protein